MSRLTKEQAEIVEGLIDAIRNEGSLTERLEKVEPSLDLELEVASTALVCYILDLKDELAARWQPIETAPKDGTHIRAYGTRHGSWGYSEDELVSIDAAWHWKERRWIDVRDPSFIPRRFTPTHWMPLPEPPQ